MHPNPIFRRATDTANIEFARQRGFGALSINGAAGPLLAHVPFVLGAEGEMAELHLLRSNPILRALEEPQPAVIAVHGPDSYISPDWYEIDDQVPTWNYIAVHLRGRLERLPQNDLRGVLDRLSADFEARLAPKPPWMASKMTAEVLEKMMRMIVPCRLRLDGIDGTWKLGQNKDGDARLRAADQVERNGIGADVTQLAARMRTPG